MGNFSDIRRAEELMKAKEAYDLWLKKSAAEKKAAYNAQKAQTQNPRSARGIQKGYIMPFGVEPSKTIYVNVNLLGPEDGTPETGEESATGLITKVTGAVIGASLYATTTKPTGTGIIVVELKSPRFALVKLTEREGTTKQLTSRITGRPYSYTKTNSVSCPFGQKLPGGSDYEAAKAAIRTALSPASNQTVSFQPQGEINISVS